MKKLSLTWIIVIAGLAAALCMLANAFAPAFYKSLATTVFLFAMLGLAMVVAPEKKPTWKWFGDVLAVLIVLGVIAWACGKFLPGFLTIPVFATLGALGMLLLKENDYMLPVAMAAAAIAVYAAGDIAKYELLAVAFVLASAAINARKIKSVPVKIVAAFIICLAMCAFK